MADYQDWRRALLARMSFPQTPENLQFLEDWQQQEGGHTNNSAQFNWLNTTWGERYPAINSHGVRSYPDMRTGIENLARTLLSANGQRYGGILTALQSGHGTSAWDTAASDFQTWGTKTRPTGSGAAPMVLDAQDFGLTGVLGNVFKMLGANQQELLAQAHTETQQAQAQAQQLQQQFGAAAGAPGPEVPADQQFWARLAGNLSQAIDPSIGGAQQAESALASKQAQISGAHQRSLEVMAQKLQHAIGQADAAGDRERSLTLQTKYTTVLKAIDAQLQTARTDAMGRRGSSASNKISPQVEGQVKGIDAQLKALRSGDLKSKDKNAVRRARRAIANLEARRGAILNGQNPSEVPDVLAAHGLDLIKQASSKGWSRQDLIRYINGLDRNSADVLELENQGLDQRMLRDWIDSNWPDQPTAAGGGTAQPPQQVATAPSFLPSRGMITEEDRAKNLALQFDWLMRNGAHMLRPAHQPYIPQQNKLPF